MRRSLIDVALIWCLLLNLACGPLGPSPEVKAFADRYFQLRKANQTGQLMALYGSSFFQATSRDKWQKTLEKTAEKLGALESYELRNSHKFTYSGTSNSGTTTTLIYDVRYAKYPAIETLVIFQPVGGGPVITGHNIQSDGFLE